MMKTKRPALHVGDHVQLAPHVRSIPAYEGKPAVLSSTRLRVSCVTGTGSKRNPYSVVTTDGVHFWHHAPDDVVPAAPSE
jgi:hypothetical protein